MKQLVLSAEDYAEHHSWLRRLDVRRQRAEVAVTVENAPAAIERLRAEGAIVRVIDLNLDDIFAAYVIGNPGDAGETSPVAPLAISA